MNFIITMEGDIKRQNQKYWFTFLSVQKYFVEKNFEWLKLYIDLKSKELKGKGVLEIQGKRYEIILSFSPFFKYRYDRIFINDRSIKYTRDNHMYGDNSLCLYHPVVDKPLLETIPLHRMIPWITEWIVWYKHWKKYGVWLGDEIKH